MTLVNLFTIILLVRNKLTEENIYNLKGKKIMKGLIGAAELLLYPFYIIPALFGFLLVGLPVGSIFGKDEEWMGDAFVSILDPTEGVR